MDRLWWGGAKFWLQVLTELKNRGTDDVCIVVCDGLTGLPDAIAATWPLAVVQTCVLHLIRNTFKLASRRDQRVRELLSDVVAAFGLDAATTYWDPPRLRVLPAGADLEDRDDMALEAHRDTWSSNVYAQVNWWIPLHAVTAERAIVFYPRHWCR